MKFYTLTLNLEHEGRVHIEEIEVRETSQFYMTVDGKNTLPNMKNRISKARMSALKNCYTNTGCVFFSQSSVDTYDIKLFLERVQKDLETKEKQIHESLNNVQRKQRWVTRLTIANNNELIKESRNES